MLSLLLLAALQDQPPPKPPQEFEAKFQTLQSWEEGGLEVVYMSGTVQIRSPDGTLKADRVIGWRRKLGPRPFDFDELYAEGAVTYATPRASITARGLFIDRKLDRALIFDFVMRAQGGPPGIPVVFRAKEARRLSVDRYVLEQVAATTCVYGSPHYDVRIARADVTVVADPREAPADRGGWGLFPRGGDIYVAADDITLWYSALPVFYFPGMTYRLGDDLVLRSIEWGSSSRFGGYVYTDWGLSFESGFGRDRQRWGELILEADYRRIRGYAEGLDFRWNAPPVRGYIDTYYLRDRGPNEKLAYESKFLPLEDEDRFRARLFHRHDLSPEVRVEAEVSYLTDRNLLREFFAAEFKEGKEQESTLYFRGLHGPVAWFAQYRARLNDFQTQLEYLPRFEFWWMAARVGPVQLSGSLEIASLRQTFDEALATPSFQTERIDVLQEAVLPIDLGPVQILPYAAARLGAWGDDLAGESETRVVTMAGVSVRTRLSRTFDVSAMGLDGLRHIVEIQARAMRAHVRDFDPASMFPFDGVDALTSFEEIAFEIVQRFQTRERDAKGEARGILEFLTLGVAAEYYPDPDRDTTAFNANSFAYPFDPMGIFPLPGRPFESRRWSNVFWAVDFTPRGGAVTLRARGEWDPLEREEATHQIGLRVALGAAAAIGLSNTYVKDGTSSFGYTASLALTPRWKFEWMLKQDRESGDILVQRLGLARDLHDVVVRVTFENDRVRDDINIMLMFEPKFGGQAR
jgi:hypothetical protein